MPKPNERRASALRSFGFGLRIHRIFVVQPKYQARSTWCDHAYDFAVAMLSTAVSSTNFFFRD